MALVYRWILIGHVECQIGEKHNYILYDNIEQFTSFTACKVNIKHFTNMDTVYIGTEYTIRILCQPPVIGDLMPYVFDGIAACHSDDENSSSDSEDSDIYASEVDSNDIIKPWLRWELYKKTKCGDDNHFLLHSTHSQLHLDMVDCIYEFSEYYLSEICCSHPQWRLHIYCK